jgi:excisionase family DNA binding protein
MENLAVIQVSDLKHLLSEVVREELHRHLPSEKDSFSEFPELLSRRQVSQLLGVSIGTIDNWSECGRLKKIHMGAAIRFRKSELLETLDSLKLFQRTP